MSIVLLLCIPIFAIGITIFVGSLVTFIVTNEINYVLLLISMFITIVSGFLISKNLKSIMPNTVKSLNIIKNMDIYYGYFNFILFVLFGLAYLGNYFFSQNVINLAIGGLCISFFIYVTYAFFGDRKEVRLKVKYIDDTIKNVKCLTLVDDSLSEYKHYFKSDFNVNVGDYLNFYYYKHTKMIKNKPGDINERK
jgi:hypothetical protein